MHLARPAGTHPTRVRWPFAIGIVLVHLLACLAFVPYFFSWTGVVLALLGLYVYGTLGINLCYHRLLTHQGFETSKWLERLFVFLGICCFQGPPARWVAIHRMHHQQSDQEDDPHSPWVDLIWGHVGWIVIANRDLSTLDFYERYARDILRDRFYRRCEHPSLWVGLYALHALGYLLVGLVLGGLLTGTLSGAAQFGASLFVWGVAVRTVLVWHITWSVNSLTHLWGYQAYETGENSRNNWFVALISNGEGWHNNHHADQRAAAHGHRWWEFDVTWITIRAMAAVGLAKEVIVPRSWQKPRERS